MFPQLLTDSYDGLPAPKLGVEGSCIMSTLLCDCELMSSLSLSRRNPEGASVCLWCVIQARRVKCETYLRRLIKNRTDVWMCWSTMPMLGFRYSLNFDPNSALMTSYCDP